MYNYLKILVPLTLLGISACGDDAPSAPVDDPGTPDASAGQMDAGRSWHIDASVKPAASAADGGSTRDAGAAVKPAAGAAQPGSSVPSLPKLRPKCVKKPSQVMMVGDSYMNWITHTFGADMAKESGQMWRMEAVGAYSMGSGGIGFIPDLYQASIMRDPDCHTVVMDGGGNDVLVADSSIDPNKDCETEKSPMLAQCQTIIDKALAAADKMLMKASADGIRDVVYFFYPHVPLNTPVGGPNPNPILDKALPQVRDFCAHVEAKTNGKTRCHFLDLVPVFDGHMPDWYQPFDIHENSLGSAAIAKSIWALMKDNCLGQVSGTSCCEE
ncbi:MAG: hypothetical protein JWN04_1329 [Myxococcaceae bacterium]|nr:hypothetical protein [Myxococcaceae bacterium]